MLTKRIIPCLDVDAGRVVKGTSFINLRDAGNPVELAAFYNREGADELVFLDITASSEFRSTITEVVEKVSDQVFIPLTVGGGIRSINDIRNLLAAGADKVSLNSAAVASPSLITNSALEFGSQCIVAAIDARRSNSTNPDRSQSPWWEVFTHGGRRPTGICAVTWAQELEGLGAGEILLTSMDADGHQQGYDLDLIKAITSSVNVPVIASGGVGVMEHFSQAALESGADALLAATVFHYGQFRICDVKQYMAARGIPVRMEQPQT